jgi:hypothetical protein
MRLIQNFAITNSLSGGVGRSIYPYIVRIVAKFLYSWTLCSWKIALSPVETLRHISSLSYKFIRKVISFLSSKSIRKDK